MACDSLRLLKAALPSSVPKELLDERVWGSVIGMFELNNLALQVQSPLELYFLACDDLPEPRRAEVLGQTGAWLDALDTDYDACVEVRCYSRARVLLRLISYRAPWRRLAEACGGLQPRPPVIVLGWLLTFAARACGAVKYAKV